METSTVTETVPVTAPVSETVESVKPVENEVKAVVEPVVEPVVVTVADKQRKPRKPRTPTVSVVKKDVSKKKAVKAKRENKRPVSLAPVRPWMNLLKTVYGELKKDHPNMRYKDAMSEAKLVYNSESYVKKQEYTDEEIAKIVSDYYKVNQVTTFKTA